MAKFPELAEWLVRRQKWACAMMARRQQKQAENDALDAETESLLEVAPHENEAFLKQIDAGERRGPYSDWLDEKGFPKLAELNRKWQREKDEQEAQQAAADAEYEAHLKQRRQEGARKAAETKRRQRLETDPACPFPSIKAILAAGFVPRRLHYYRPEGVWKLKGRWFVKGFAVAVSRSEWKRRGRIVKPDAQPLTELTPGYCRRGWVKVYTEDDTVPKL